MNTDEFIVTEEVEPTSYQPQKKSLRCPITCNMIILVILLAAVAVLYVLHFTAPTAPVFTAKTIVEQPGSGEIVFVNLDTVNEKYELVAILTGDIRTEMVKQDAIFSNREKAFQKKYNQFEENAKAGILTQVQMENAQMQLAQEYQQLEADKERIFSNLQDRQAAALVQIYDSLQAAVKRINVERNASYIITYQNQSPFLLLTDPSKEITDYVLYELNRSFKK
jgi:Skp family chaperone for outer membrane proteins